MGWFFNSDSDKERQNSNKQPRDAQLTNNNNQNYQIIQNFHSYSSSKSCRSDPQDQEYLICTQKINDGGNIKTKETRVHASEAHFGGFPSIFSNFFTGIDSTSRVLDHRLQQLDKDFAQDIEKVANSFMPFFMMFDPQFAQLGRNSRKFQNGRRDSHNNYQNYSNQQRTSQRNYQNHKNSHYFSSNQKDFQIKDL